MADQDSRLRELYDGVRAQPPGEHPSDEAWERLALHELGASEREALMDHVTRCAACTSMYRGLRELETEARTFDPGLPKPMAPAAGTRVTRPLLYSGLAAAAVLIVALFLPPRIATTPPDDSIRSAPAAAPVPVYPVGEITGRPETLSWQPLPGADRYRVEVFTGDGSGSWTSPPVAGTRVDWPNDFLPRPGVYYWKVTALPGSDPRVTSEVASRLMMFAIAEPRASVPKPR